MVDLPPMDIGSLVEFFVLLAGVLGVWFTVRNDIANMKARQAAQDLLLKQHAEKLEIHGAFEPRLRQVESHGEKVEQIAPLAERMSSFERHTLETLSGMRDQMRELAQSVRDLTSAFVGKARQIG